MLSGLEHEVRNQLSNTEHKGDRLLKDWMEPDSPREGFSKSHWVFYWWHFHNCSWSQWPGKHLIYCEFHHRKRAARHSALAGWAKVSARLDCNLPSGTGGSDVTSSAVFWADRQKSSKSPDCRTDILPILGWDNVGFSIYPIVCGRAEQKESWIGYMKSFPPHYKLIVARGPAFTFLHMCADEGWVCPATWMHNSSPSDYFYSQCSDT